MTFSLIKKEVGPWPMNAYVIVCQDTEKSAVVDPGADPDKLLELAQETQVEKILLTHGHFDHVGALNEVKLATGAPVYIHPADAEKFQIDYDVPLSDGDMIEIGNQQLRAIHTPGHTPGMVSFDLGDGRILVGDTIFVGGPGKTWSSEEFEKTMDTMQNIVFEWSDSTEFFPGHGPSGKIGEERQAFTSFVEKGWSKDLHGDITWERSNPH